jgi:DNA-binding GntR family transcriptional regulator
MVPGDSELADPRAYRRLAAIIREEIRNEKLVRGQPVPSITALKVEHGHARQTCSKAYSVLMAEGLVARFPGLGYFVVARREAAHNAIDPADGRSDLS